MIEARSILFVGLCTIQLVRRSRAAGSAATRLAAQAHSFLARSFRESVFQRAFTDNQAMVWGVLAAFLAIVLGAYVPGLNDLLELTGFGWQGWVMILVATVLHVVLVEALKWALRHFNIAVI